MVNNVSSVANATDLALSGRISAACWAECVSDIAQSGQWSLFDVEDGLGLAFSKHGKKLMGLLKAAPPPGLRVTVLWQGVFDVEDADEQ